MNKLINELSSSVPVRDDEHLGEDGLPYCNECGEPRHYILDVQNLGINKVVRCICSCMAKKYEEQELTRHHAEYEVKRKQCFFYADEMRYWTFENDDSRNPKWTEAMRRYADKFEEFKLMRKGLLLYGDVGTGKTYYAASIANKLIDRGYSVKFRTFKNIEGEYFNAPNKAQFVKELNQCDLLILDDLGVERKSEFMNELVFDVINSRYNTGLPFICTTNLTGEELKSPANISNERIYDRILERCYPFKMEGQSRRKQNLAAMSEETQMMLGL
jgi:DNA replication protein DnaC